MKELVCKRCTAIFTAAVVTCPPKHCDTCRPIHLREKNRQDQARRRASPDYIKPSRKRKTVRTRKLIPFAGKHPS